MKGSPVSRTTSGVVLVKDKPIRIYGVTIESGAIGGIVNFRNGDTVDDPSLLRFQGTANDITSMPDINSDHGFYFPDGLFLSLDGNVTRITVWVEMMSAS